MWFVGKILYDHIEQADMSDGDDTEFPEELEKFSDTVDSGKKEKFSIMSWFSSKKEKTAQKDTKKKRKMKVSFFKRTLAFSIFPEMFWFTICLKR